MKQITIIDCGMGNRAAIRNMLKVIEESSSITSSIDDIKDSDIIILPGIGSFDSFLLSIRKLNLQDVIKEHVLIHKKPTLGICVGMQALFNNSEEGNQKGNIKAFECIIGGKFEGDVTAESLAIESAANIKGNMYYNSLSARPGANLDIQLFRGLDKRIEDKSSEKDKKKKQSKKSKGI